VTFLLLYVAKSVRSLYTVNYEWHVLVPTDTHLRTDVM
jgi:hypothetical protein